MRRSAALVALLVAALLAAGCGAQGSELSNADPANGKQLFVQGADGNQPCGACHTLADAATISTVGPSLDDAFARMRAEGFPESTIFRITLKQIDLAAPPMPPDLVTGEDALDVAAYVASVAGKSPEELEQQAGGGGGATATAP